MATILTLKQIREQAEVHLFSSMLAPSHSQSYDDDTLGSSKLDGETYLTIIQALAYTIPENGGAQIGQVLADKANVLTQSLQNLPQGAAQIHDHQLSYICFW